jgi:hypothetical protein
LQALLSRYQQAVSSKDEIERQVEDQENSFKELETIYSKVSTYTYLCRYRYQST